jgi:lactate permease
MHPLLASLPILALIAVMTVRAPKARLPMPAHLALPGAAAAALALQTFAGASPGARTLAARIIEGALTALMPLSIVFGALLLFRTLTASGAMDAITARLERWAPDPVLRVLLIAWAFAYLVEGLSGFGTPAALAAPLLVGLGFPAVRAAAACLVMNTVPVVFGAVGMPVWFGFGELELTPDELRSIGLSAAILQCAAAPVVVAVALRLLFPWKELRARAWPIALVVLATVAASAATTLVSVEFPTVVGGLAALIAAGLVGRFLRRAENQGAPERTGEKSLMPAWKAAFPLAMTVALLAVTRIEPLGLRALLNAQTPSATLDLGALGSLSVSAALVVSLEGILRTDIHWSMALLYVPFIIPFVAVVLISAPVIGLRPRKVARVAGNAARSLALAAAALVGALVFVKLMMHGDQAAPVVAIGRALADAVAALYAPLWLAAAPVVGALGSFFSGSATVSNLTFGPVQAEIAERLDLQTTRVLALQAIGAAMGNMVCIHNIIAVAAVLGLTGAAKKTASSAPKDAETKDAEPPRPSGSSAKDPVAEILRLNARPLAAFALIAALTAAAMAALAPPA